MTSPRVLQAMGVKPSHNPLSPAFMPPPRYGSHEWMLRHVASGHVPVGVVRGCVIDYVRFPKLSPTQAKEMNLTAGEAARKGMLCKVVGGSAESPTVIALTPEEMKNAIWTVSRNDRSGVRTAGGDEASLASRIRPGDIRRMSATGDSAISASQTNQGPGATPWIAGGLILAMAIGLKAAEVKMGART